MIIVGPFQLSYSNFPPVPASQPAYQPLLHLTFGCCTSAHTCGCIRSARVAMPAWQTALTHSHTAKALLTHLLLPFSSSPFTPGPEATTWEPTQELSEILPWHISQPPVQGNSQRTPSSRFAFFKAATSQKRHRPVHTVQRAVTTQGHGQPKSQG